jgi:hypothetical protein
MNYAPHVAAIRAVRKNMKRPAGADSGATKEKKWPSDKSYAAFLRSRPPIPKGEKK